jgi:hypothetical protein
MRAIWNAEAMTGVAHRWSLSNPGPGTLSIWLEPWAEELEVPVKSTVAMEWFDASQDGEIGELEWTSDHLVIWADVSTLKVFIDNVLQDTSSAAIPIPAGLTKAMLQIGFAGQPAARLGGAYGGLVKRESWWSRLRRRIGFRNDDRRGSTRT